MPKLKAQLKAKGLNEKGKKSQLIERLMEGDAPSTQTQAEDPEPDAEAEKNQDVQTTQADLPIATSSALSASSAAERVKPIEEILAAPATSLPSKKRPPTEEDADDGTTANPPTKASSSTPPPEKKARATPERRESVTEGNETVELDYGADDDVEDDGDDAGDNGRSKDQNEDKSEAQHTSLGGLPCWIHIQGLVRPMNARKLTELLAPFGSIREGTLRTDRNKTQCTAEFVDGNAAAAAVADLNNQQWPPERLDHGRISVAIADSNQLEDASTDSNGGEDNQLNRREERKREEQERRDRRGSGRDRERSRDAPSHLSTSLAGRLGVPAHQLSVAAEAAAVQAREARVVHVVGGGYSSMGGTTIGEEAELESLMAPSTLKLDDVFRKTKAEPCIYFLPLTDAQAVARATMMQERRDEATKKEREFRDRGKSEAQLRREQVARDIAEQNKDEYPNGRRDRGGYNSRGARR